MGYNNIFECSNRRCDTFCPNRNPRFDTRDSHDRGLSPGRDRNDGRSRCCDRDGRREKPERGRCERERPERGRCERGRSERRGPERGRCEREIFECSKFRCDKSERREKCNWGANLCNK